ncbi:methyltransferase domain-containing protein, partial [bacterium]|nr:methyltransferase domain-containing protein [candidate division CSSED10-310 bacterium]
GRYWNANAPTWTELARKGYDIYRDSFNTPGFFHMLPDIKNLNGLDIGCGEGHNTRLLAKAGASVTALDISGRFIDYAAAAESYNPMSIHYLNASAVALPFGDNCFDFATGFMSFMDIPETEKVIAEAFRILKPGGFLQFSIMHPCFDTPYRKNLRDENGQLYAVEVGDYFRNLNGEMSEWIFSQLPPELAANYEKFKIPRFTRTLSQWFNLLIDTGFRIDRIGEPYPSDKALKIWPDVQDALIVAYFLHIRVVKPH